VAAGRAAGRLALLLLLAGAAARADTDEEARAACAALEDERERLACFDALAAEEARQRAESDLERLWDLSDRATPFKPWAHRPNYVLPARWTDDPNEEPFLEDVEPGEEPLELDPVEIKFQISFKTKLMDDLAGSQVDLWFAYTQQSHLQAYNSDASRPFRETDFEPEAMVSFPARVTWGGWTWRVVGAGFVHQSNGRSEPLSRSWNRVYAFAGIERGELSFQLRPWVRIAARDESGDDNPGISDYIGRFEAVGLWTPGRWALSARGRANLDLGDFRGSLQLDGFIPLGDSVRLELQLFTGYGESLIDYDHRQTTLGVGVLLFDPF
jgi:phospholipase A1